MALNRTTFFAYARRAPFGGRLSTDQVAGAEAILDAFQRAGFADHRWLAYALATAFHETGATMQPVREAFGRSDADTVAKLDRAWAAGRLPQVASPYWREGWFGRGFVQLTFRENYAKAGGLVGVDLVARPEKAMELRMAADILVLGMARGIFTGKSLGDYFGPLPGDPEGARRIVNGRDKAKLIASYYKAFKDALDAASELTPQPVDVDPAAALPDDKPIEKSGSAIAIGTAAAGAAGTAAVGAATTAVTGVSNGWALAAFGLVLLFVLISGGVGLWLALTGRLTILRGKPAA